MPGFQPGVTINEQSQLAVTTGLRASSYEPGFRDLALPLNPLEDFQYVDTRGLASSVSKISVFPTEISVSGLGILLYEYFSPNTGMTVGWIMAVRMASSCIACCIFHIISIPFNCSDTAFRVAEAMIGTKVIIFFVAPCLLCFSNLAREHIPGSLAISHLRNRAEISHMIMNPKQNVVQVTKPARSTMLMWRGLFLKSSSHFSGLKSKCYSPVIILRI